MPLEKIYDREFKVRPVSKNECMSFFHQHSAEVGAWQRGKRRVLGFAKFKIGKGYGIKGVCDGVIIIRGCIIYIVQGGKFGHGWTQKNEKINDDGQNENEKWKNVEHNYGRQWVR